MQDSEIGMDGTMHSRIGEMFFTTKEGGNGIGLAECFRIAMSMGAGSMSTVRSDEARRSRCSFPPCESSFPMSQLVGPSMWQSHLLSATTRILVVEEDEGVANHLTSALMHLRSNTPQTGRMVLRPTIGRPKGIHRSTWSS